MPRNTLFAALFLAGLGLLCWIALGHAGSNPLAFVVTLVISAAYLAGIWELHRYRQATATLAQAIDGLTTAPASLGEWLASLPSSLRDAVRLRIEGTRTALPAPSLAPYLVGLLVLLGMLGTLLGMMTTLRGTGMALETATDLQAIRDSLAAPVKGLGFAFGASIAGIAGSAMLGLLVALSRREQLAVAQRLDAAIAGTLRVHSQTHQREETLRLMQRQAELMPALVDRLQAMADAIERQGQAAHVQQTEAQRAFHERIEASHATLAGSMAQTLRDSVTATSQAATATLQPAIDSTLSALARETTALHDTVTGAVQRQLDAVSNGFEASTATVTGLWQDALDQQRQANATMIEGLRGTLVQFNDGFEQRSAQWLEQIGARLDANAGRFAETWQQALARQEASHDALATRQQQTFATIADGFGQHAASLLQGIDRSHAGLQAALAEQDAQRLSAWNDTLGAIATGLREHLEHTAELAATRQQATSDALARTADEIAARTQAHASETITEISRLVQAASEAPKIAAEVVTELRQKLSDSMARDNLMLEERNRMLATLDTLLDAVSHASTEQRTAIDALVATSTDLLERVGGHFAEQVEHGTGKLGAVADQVSASAIDVASLGEAFATAAQAFGQNSQTLAERLERIEDALAASMARSDEQLAYYVAQAREVIDLSMLAQKQIVEDMQQLAGSATAANTDSEAA